mgnify:CR=1 FL=1
MRVAPPQSRHLDCMPVKSFNPVTPSRRYMKVSSFSEITKTKPEKRLVKTKKKTGGAKALQAQLGKQQQRLKVLKAKDPKTPQVTNQITQVEKTIKRLKKRQRQLSQVAMQKNRGGVASKATLLGAEEVDLTKFADIRTPLMEWLRRKDNRLFARAFVNRMWAHCFGRGLVEPIDDMRVTNPATNPQLLDALANEFVDSGFNMRRILELITTSTTYQLDSSANVDNLDETQGHSRFYPQRLSAEMLLDSIDQVTSRPTAYGGLPVGTRAMQLPDENYSNQFLKLFGRPPRESACECERTAAPSLSQSLFSLNDSFLPVSYTHLTLPPSDLV